MRKTIAVMITCARQWKRKATLQVDTMSSVSLLLPMLRHTEAGDTSQWQSALQRLACGKPVSPLLSHDSHTHVISDTVCGCVSLVSSKSRDTQRAVPGQKSTLTLPSASAQPAG